MLARARRAFGTRLVIRWGLAGLILAARDLMVPKCQVEKKQKNKKKEKTENSRNITPLQRCCNTLPRQMVEQLQQQQQNNASTMTTVTTSKPLTCHPSYDV